MDAYSLDFFDGESTPEDQNLRLKSHQGRFTDIIRKPLELS